MIPPERAGHTTLREPSRTVSAQRQTIKPISHGVAPIEALSAKKKDAWPVRAMTEGNTFTGSVRDSTPLLAHNK